jgi:hypothetical protein
MAVTMEANQVVNARLGQEGLTGYEVHPTCSLSPRADGEITVYAPGRVQVANVIVQETSVPAEVAERILEQVRAANPAVSAPSPVAIANPAHTRDEEPDADIAADAADPRN